MDTLHDGVGSKKKVPLGAGKNSSVITDAASRKCFPDPLYDLLFPDDILPVSATFPELLSPRMVVFGELRR